MTLQTNMDPRGAERPSGELLAAELSASAYGARILQPHVPAVDWTKICLWSGILLNSSHGLCIRHIISSDTSELDAVHGVFDSQSIDAFKQSISSFALADFSPDRFQRADDFRPLLFNHMPHSVGADRDCHCLVVGTSLDEDSFELISLIRPGSAAPFQPEDMARAKAIRGFIREAVRQTSNGHAASADGALQCRILDQLPFGVVCLGPLNIIEFANKPAMELFERADGLKNIAQSIAATDSMGNAALQAALANCRVQESGACNSRMLLISRPKTGRPLMLTLEPVLSRSRSASVLVYIVDPNVDISGAVQQVCACYGMTQVEVELICHLISGLPLQDVSAEMKIKTDTARGYLKRIFSKMGVNRQADLVKTVLSSCLPSVRPRPPKCR